MTKINEDEDEEDVVVDDDDAEEDNWAEKEEDAARDGVPRRRIVCGDSRSGSAWGTGAWRALILLIVNVRERDGFSIDEIYIAYKYHHIRVLYLSSINGYRIDILLYLPGCTVR